MNGNFNKSAFQKLERTLAEALDSCATVRVKIDIIYAGGRARPDGFVVNYSIDGVKGNAEFENIAGG